MEGKPFELAVRAQCRVALKYRWRQGGHLVENATQLHITVEHAQPSDEGNYVCEVYTDRHLVASNPAKVSVDRQAPSSLYDFRL